MADVAIVTVYLEPEVLDGKFTGKILCNHIQVVDKPTIVNIKRSEFIFFDILLNYILTDSGVNTQHILRDDFGISANHIEIKFINY